MAQEAERQSEPKVNPVDGEVEPPPPDPGVPGKPWDDGITRLDALARVFQQTYGEGFLVTVDETTRIKPLSIPISAALLDEMSERKVGALTRKQSFSLKVLDAGVDKEVEKCRKVDDLMDLLTFPLGLGNHWIPMGARALLDRELEARNQHGMEVLKKALGGTVEEFVRKRTDSIREDLNRFYKEFGKGDKVPDEKLREILQLVEERLKAALNGRITPRANYNRVFPPDLTALSPDHNWSQPFSLLTAGAKRLREFLTNPFKATSFKKLTFTADEFEGAMNVFEDSILKSHSAKAASDELVKLDEIQESEEPLKRKCQSVWQIIRGEPDESTSSTGGARP
jgi:hypothetical protein